jgi:hypothetical protein
MSEALNLKLWRLGAAAAACCEFGLGGQAMNNGPTINELEERIAVMRQNIDELVERVRPRLRWSWVYGRRPSLIPDDVGPPSAVFETWRGKQRQHNLTVGASEWVGYDKKGEKSTV